MTKLAFISSDTPKAQDRKATLIKLYGDISPEEADVIVALGGDGLMLETLRKFLPRDVPIYGIHCGTVGFLMNNYAEKSLVERIENARKVTLHPLRMKAVTCSGEKVEAVAINEVSLLRQTRQASKLRLLVDGVERLKELTCDGVIVATPAGSTAYNLSAHGPIIPLDSNILALTPLSPFRPRRWKGALLSHRVNIRIEILESNKRPVSAVADFTEVRDVASVDITEDRSVSLSLLFDPEQDLAERILAEQFVG